MARSANTHHPMRRREDALTRRMKEVCDAVGAFIEYWGFKGALGRIWCYLALRRTPLNQAELSRRLGVSRALVSGSVAELARLGLVRPVAARRQVPYEAVVDVWPAITGVLRSREWTLLESARLSLDAAIEELELATAHGRAVEFDIERLRMLLRMTNLAKRLLHLLIALKVNPAAERLGDWLGRVASFVRATRESA